MQNCIFLKKEKKTFEFMFRLLTNFSDYKSCKLLRDDILKSYYSEGKILVLENDERLPKQKYEEQRNIITQKINEFQVFLKKNYQESNKIKQYLNTLKQELSNESNDNNEYLISNYLNESQREKLLITNNSLENELNESENDSFHNISDKNHRTFKNPFDQKLENKNNCDEIICNSDVINKENNKGNLSIVYPNCLISINSNDNSSLNFQLSSENIMKKDSNKDLFLNEKIDFKENCERKNLSFFENLFCNPNNLEWKVLLEKRNQMKEYYNNNTFFALEESDNKEENRKLVLSMILRFEFVLKSKRQLSKKANGFLTRMKKEFM